MKKKKKRLKRKRKCEKSMQTLKNHFSQSISFVPINQIKLKIIKQKCIRPLPLEVRPKLAVSRPTPAYPMEIANTCWCSIPARRCAPRASPHEAQVVARRQTQVNPLCLFLSEFVVSKFRQHGSSYLVTFSAMKKKIYNYTTLN